MSSTTEPTAPLVAVPDLDVRATLLEAAAERRRADRSEARLLELAIQVVHLFPVTEDTAIACWRDPLLTVPDEGDPITDHLAGAGTPMAAGRAVEELAAALEISFRVACGLVSEALELRYRLPRLWALVQSGVLQAWKARRVAKETTHLSREAVAFVDAQAAIAGARNQVVPNLAGLIAETRIRFDPDLARAHEEHDLTHREVTFVFHGETVGSATFTATLDLVDAYDLDATVSGLATQLGRLGDTDPLDARRAHALGLLANPQRVLDLFGQPTQRTEREGLAITGTTLYVHLTGDDLHAHLDDGQVTPASIEKLGTATLDLIRGWLQRTDRVTVKPVLDLSQPESNSDAVDRHDPPGWMRDLVMLRDGHCVFPGCNVDARRCDLDHCAPYIPIDEGGPPGQTNPANLACLCRRHHRLKTFASWRYERAGPGTYRWTNPHRLTYESRPTGKH